MSGAPKIVKSKTESRNCPATKTSEKWMEEISLDHKGISQCCPLKVTTKMSSLYSSLYHEVKAKIMQKNHTTLFRKRPKWKVESGKLELPGHKDVRKVDGGNKSRSQRDITMSPLKSYNQNV